QHLDGPPVRPRLGQGVGEEQAVRADPDRRHGGGAVGGQRVRSQQQGRRVEQLGHTGRGEQLVLVELARIGDDEVPSTAFPRRTPPRRGEQRRGQLEQRRRRREGLQVWLGQRVLQLHERPGAVGVRILQVPIGI